MIFVRDEGDADDPAFASADRLKELTSDLSSMISFLVWAVRGLGSRAHGLERKLTSDGPLLDQFLH
jgi:hypothetical protein